MKSPKILAAFFAFALLGLTVLPASVSAEAVRTENVSIRCTRITNRVDTILTNYETRKERYLERHDRLVTRIQTLLDRLESHKYDTTEIVEILGEIKVMRGELIEEHKAFIQDLNDSKNYACGSSEGKFKGEIESSREHLKNAREKSKEIREYMREVLVPALKELREQKPDSN